MASDLVDFLNFILPNRQTCFGWFAVKLCFSAVGNQVGFETSGNGFFKDLI